MITIDVLGTPAPKGNVRAFLNKKTGRAYVSASGGGDRQKRQQSWEHAVRAQAVDAIVSLGDAAPTGPLFVGKALSVLLEFRVVRPAGHWNVKTGKLKPSAPMFPATKPDVDKLARSTLDCLTGLVFDDDSRIVELIVRKVYAAPGHEGALIEVEEWRPTELQPVTAIVDPTRSLREEPEVKRRGSIAGCRNRWHHANEQVRLAEAGGFDGAEWIAKRDAEAAACLAEHGIVLP